MINSVAFWDRMRAEEYSYKSSDVVISITDYGMLPAVLNGAGEIVRVSFADVITSMQTEWGYMKAVTKEDIQTIVAPIQRWHEQPDIVDVIVHCSAGASRSAAVALFVHALSGCKFPTIHGALYANRLVLAKFLDATGIDASPCMPTSRES